MSIEKEDLSYIDIGEGELLEITKKTVKVKDPTPPWNMVGNGMSNRTGTSIDFIDICAELNQAELRLLKFFRDVYNENIRNREVNTNQIVPAKEELFSPYLSKALEKNYKHMAFMEIVVRVKRGTYLVNPNLFIPGANYSSINKVWNELIKKEV